MRFMLWRPFTPETGNHCSGVIPFYTRMKINARSAFAFLAVLFCGFLFAAPSGPISVDYLSGRAELRVGGAWRELTIGERLPPGASIVRTAEKTILQVSRSGVRLSISAKGSWDLEALFSSGAAQRGPSLAQRIGQALKESRKETTAMGIRSAEALGPVLLVGRYAEAEAALEQSVKAFMSDDLSTAEQSIAEAEEIYSWTDGRDGALAARIAFWGATILAAQNRDGEALASLESQDWRLSGDVAGQYLILQARLALDTLAPERALALCAQAKDAAASISSQEAEIVALIEKEAESFRGK